METAGIKVDAPQPAQALSAEFEKRMLELEQEIHKLAGRPFNVGSPKQLGEILFDEQNLPGGKRNKNGSWATDVSILEDLAAQGHALPVKIMEHRQISKLKGTYTDALVRELDAKTGRVHTSYQMTGAATGRLASTDPNLQNIPVRTEEGRKIRQAFIAEQGHKLLSADYSQIELRLLAHVADIASLKEAFARGDDIHAITASEMFGVPVKGMDPLVRRRAKAINFGIIYGISAFGLANQLGIGQQEAREYIAKYFQRYPGIRDYMETTKEYARKHGYVKTPFGRKIHLQLHQRQEPGHARLRRARGDQRPAAGRRRRHHQAGDDPPARRAQGRQAQEPHAAAGARRTAVRGARQGDRQDQGRGAQGDGRRRHALGAAGRRYRRRRQLGGGALGPCGFAAAAVVAVLALFAGAPSQAQTDGAQWQLPSAGLLYGSKADDREPAVLRAEPKGAKPARARLNAASWPRGPAWRRATAASSG